MQLTVFRLILWRKLNSPYENEHRKKKCVYFNSNRYQSTQNRFKASVVIINRRLIRRMHKLTYRFG